MSVLTFVIRKPAGSHANVRECLVIQYDTRGARKHHYSTLWDDEDSPSRARIESSLLQEGAMITSTPYMVNDEEEKVVCKTAIAERDICVLCHICE